jgi:hypothetical protein
MNTNTIHSTITKWAEETDERIQVALEWGSSNYELIPQTKVRLDFRCELTGRRPYLEIWLPHARRTPIYFYGSDKRADEDEEFFVPSFNEEEELGIALTIVYRRFMTTHGMQRFDDTGESKPQFYRPDLIKTVKNWASGKSKPKFSMREIAPSAKNLRYGGIELRPSGKNPSGLIIRIDNDRSHFQKTICNKTGVAEVGYLPAFFTESELLGTLQTAASFIASSNKKMKEEEE